MTDDSRQPSSGDGSVAGFLLGSCLDRLDVDGAAVVVIAPRPVETQLLLHATDDTAARIEELEFTTGEGPGIDTYRHTRPTIISDLGDTGSFHRWPHFTTEAVNGLGVAAIAVFPLAVGGATFGALELYRRTPCTWTSLQRREASSLAAELGVAVGLDLIASPTSDIGFEYRGGEHEPVSAWRSKVFVAAGVLSTRLGIPIDDATAVLRARAYASSTSIEHLAVEILHNGAAVDLDE